MAYRRRRPARRPRRVARRVRRNRPGTIRQPVQYFKRSVYLSGALTALNTTDVYGAISFSLIQLPNFQEFTNLYDQYRINSIKATFIPRCNSADIGAATTGNTSGQSMGFFTVLDYDDSIPPTSINQLCEYQNMKMTRSTQNHVRYLKPRPLILVQQAGGGTAPAPTNMWIDTAQNIVPHFGIKYALQQLPAGTQTYDIKYDFNVAFKNVR